MSSQINGLKISNKQFDSQTLMLLKFCKILIYHLLNPMCKIPNSKPQAVNDSLSSINDDPFSVFNGE